MSSAIPEYFALFGLEPRFAIDLERLKRAYDEVLALVHPDRHVRAGAGERRAAMQLASHANEAYQVLRSETSRAAYLCRRHGVIVDGEGAGALALDFLEQQMAWREALDEAREQRDAAALARLSAEVQAERGAVVQRLAALLDGQGDYAGAAEPVRALMFLDKLAAECARVAAAAAA